MEPDDLIRFAGFLGLLFAFFFATILVNRVAARLIGGPSGYGFWAVSILTIPALFAAYGLYDYVTYELPCDPEGYHCLLFHGPVARTSRAFKLMLATPLLSVCASIPATYWFIAREARK